MSQIGRFDTKLLLPHRRTEGVAGSEAETTAPSADADVLERSVRGFRGGARPRQARFPPTWLRLGARGLVLTLGIAISLVGIVFFGQRYWTVGRFIVSTDDAYVQADSSTIAPRIAGYVDRVFVADNARVKAGQLLARLDDSDWAVAVDQAKAAKAAAEAAVAVKGAAIEAQKARIDSAKASMQADAAASRFAAFEDKRYAALASSGNGSLQNAQQAASRMAAADAALKRDGAEIATAEQTLKSLTFEKAQLEANVVHQAAVLHRSELDLGYTTIRSPIDGRVTNRTVRVGQYAQAGTQLLSVVPPDVYVIANYKETQLTNVQDGQPVEIAVDMFPGRTYHGRVESIAPASGQTFTLLPPDNATGNFTKVVQRIPVKILAEVDNDARDDLRPGMSVVTSIDTKVSSPAPRHD